MADRGEGYVADRSESYMLIGVRGMANRSDGSMADTTEGYMLKGVRGIWLLGVRGI